MGYVPRSGPPTMGGQSGRWRGRGLCRRYDFLLLEVGGRLTTRATGTRRFGGLRVGRRGSPCEGGLIFAHFLSS